jgi:hypothetical protein
MHGERMNERETPPDTLIGLGPPEPPEKYGAHPADAPETLRAWSTSANAGREKEATSQPAFLPLDSSFPGHVTSISTAVEEPFDVPSFRRPSAPNLVFWVAPALLTAVAMVAAALSSHGSSSDPATASVAPRVATTRVVAGYWVLRQDLPAEQPSDESSRPARIFFREPSTAVQKTSLRVAPPGGAPQSGRIAPPSARVAPPGGAPSQPEEQSSEIAADPARVRAVADGVHLEDEVAGSRETDGEPGAAEK